MAKKDNYDMSGSRGIEYETYKRKGAPDAKTTDRQIESGNKKAYERAEQAFSEASEERRRERNRAKKNQDAADGKTRLSTDDKRL